MLCGLRDKHGIGTTVSRLRCPTPPNCTTTVCTPVSDASPRESHRRRTDLSRGEPPTERCGVAFPTDGSPAETPRANCCYRERHDETAHCLWHTPKSAVEKTVSNLRASLGTAPQATEHADRILLDGAQLRGVALPKQSLLERAVLREADLSGANLAGSTLKGAILTDASLREVDLTGADMMGAVLVEADLTSGTLAQLSGDKAVMRGAILKDANLERAHLWDLTAPEAVFKRATLCEATMRDAVLPGASFTAGTLESVDFGGATLTDASFRRAGLQNAELRDADLVGADFQGADLRNASLTNADLTGANFRDADLTDAHLRGADLSEADLKDATLCGADLKDATLTRASLWNSDLTEAYLRNADLSDGYLRRVDLTDADLPAADLTGDLNARCSLGRTFSMPRCAISDHTGRRSLTCRSTSARPSGRPTTKGGSHGERTTGRGVRTTQRTPETRGLQMATRISRRIPRLTTNSSKRQIRTGHSKPSPGRTRFHSCRARCSCAAKTCNGVGIASTSSIWSGRSLRYREACSNTAKVSVAYWPGAWSLSARLRVCISASDLSK
ncbi:hypothetical protein C475_19468 [Halosimplex carlsbadense 2-9-1]|uniref:Pentapeptide repeat-containing protein n=1 Tax=Halosimplex carlsbadense 2-9-1 TaxID=797114 RepID=M0CBZ7_9EURY|nr:hypothetical protein C475_19468 [Halosimplex carlsbadense 2-9-1]